MPIIDINKFRNAEILDEENLYNEGAQELARKLIQTYASDDAKTNQIQPPPQTQKILDRYITGFLNSVVFQYGLLVKGEEFSTDDLITRWNALASFFKTDINPLYSYYVVDKIDKDIVARIEDLKEFNQRADDEGNLTYNVNNTAMDLLYRYALNGVIRVIPYSLIYNKDEISQRRLDRITQLEDERNNEDDLPEEGEEETPEEAEASGSDSEGSEGSLGGMGKPKPKKKIAGKGRLEGKKKLAYLDAALGETPSGYTTSQSYPNKDSVPTVEASYSKKGKQNKTRLFVF